MPAIQTIVATAFNKAETVVEEHEDLTAEAGMSAGARTINALEIGYTSPSAIAQVCRRIVGVADHLHLLIGLRATVCLADVVRDVKAVSSRWVHEESATARLHGREGYGAFTVSASQRDTVREYIARQEEHHRKRTFKEEYLELLQRRGLAYDERYLW